MKNSKRILAIIGVVLLLSAFCLPMITALGNGDNMQGKFIASMFVVVFVPVIIYLMMIVYRVLKKQKTPEGQIKNVVFDVGQVLMRYDWEGYLKSYGYETEKYERIANAVFRNQIWDERDRGCLTEQEYIEQMCEVDPQDAADIRIVMKNSMKTISPFDYAPTWAAYLKKQGYHLYILSNYSDYMRNETIHLMEFMKYMDGVVFSCDVKLIKPEKEIYKNLLQTYHLNAEETVFIDDRKENIDGAAAVGIRGIVFTSFKQAAAELEKLGVK